MIYVIAFLLLGAFALGAKAWASAPTWAKSKRRDSCGRTVYEIIGKIDQKDLLLVDRIKQCAGDLSHWTKQINGKDSISWPKMFFSYLVVLLNRSLLAGRLSKDQRDHLLTSYGESKDPASYKRVRGLLEKAKYAKWAYPFDPNYENLEGCLREEGYVLLEHRTITAPGKLAHYIAIDPSKKILLVVPRGSCGLSDIVTDAAGSIVDHKLQHPEDPRLDSIYSHEGCLLASKSLVQRIAPLVQRWVVNNSYRLHLVGHSLGAAVACIAGTMLRAQFKILNDPSRLHIWSYASPPCLNKESSQSMEPFLSTIVWNEDFVPTLSVPNYIFTCKIIAHMHETEREYHGKSFYVARALISSLATALGCRRLSMPAQRQNDVLDVALANMQALHKERQMSGEIDLYIPGRVIYLWERRHWNEPTGEIKGISAIGKQLPILSMFLPTKTSFSDHFLDAYERGMKQFLEQCGDDV